MKAWKLLLAGLMLVPAVVLAQTSTTTAVVSSLNPSLFGDSVRFTATVTPIGSPESVAGQGIVLTPTGTGQFKDRGTVIGATAVSTSAAGTQSGPRAALVGGNATLTTSSLTPGKHTLTAVYSGDPNNAGSTSSPLVQTVNAVLPPVVPPLAPEAAIPTLSEWALILLAVLMGVIALGSARDRKRG